MSHELYVSHHTLYDVCKIWGLCLWNMWVPTYMSHGLHESRTMWDINYMSHELYSSHIVWRLQDLGSVLWHMWVPTYMSHGLYGSRTIWITNNTTSAWLGCVTYMSHEPYGTWFIWVTDHICRGLYGICKTWFLLWHIWVRCVTYMSHKSYETWHIYESRNICVTDCMASARLGLCCGIYGSWTIWVINYVTPVRLGLWQI